MKIPDCVVRGEFLLAAKDWMGPVRWQQYLRRRNVPLAWAERYIRAARAWRQLPPAQPDGRPWSLHALLTMSRVEHPPLRAEAAGADAAD